MTTLNTIIEEEKKGAKESILETFEDGTIRYCPRVDRHCHCHHWGVEWVY